MGFFKKLFRRRKKNKKGGDEGGFLQQPDNVHHNHGHMIRKPAFNKNPPNSFSALHSPELAREDSRSRPSGKSSHDSSYGSSFDSREESHHRPGSSGFRQPHADHFVNADFQADFSAFSHKENNANYRDMHSPMNIHGKSPQGRSPQGRSPQGRSPQGRSPQGRSPAGNDRNGNALNYDQLQRLEKDQGIQGYGNPYGQPPSKKLQLTRLPSGQLVAADATNGKGAASPLSPSSDFDLSTDAEDNEYNDIRTYDAYGNVKTMLGSPENQSDEDPELSLYGRKGERRNNLYMSNSESSSFMTSRSNNYFSDSERESVGGPSPAERASVGNGEAGRTPKKNLSPQAGSKFTFDTEVTDPVLSNSRESTEFQNENGRSLKGVSPGGNSADGPSPRTIAIQQAQMMRSQGNYNNDDYANSTDSENDNGNTKKVPSSSPSKGTISSTNPQRSEGIIANFVDFENNAFDSKTSSRQSQSVADALSPVSNLLAQAEQRRRRKGASSNSISSAPMNGFPIPRPAGSASAAAREKLQKRRMEKKEWLKSNGNGSDDESDNGQGNESWLYNEVSGALGPQGIQADLESLGERSFRSRTSHKSHRSHRSTSRRKSDASVGSRHSRTSRASRSSRYSIKSTKSHLSAMSVESRSVANDLIRLEMQLAMVTNKRGENGVKKELENEAKKKGITGLTVNRHSSNGSLGGSSIGGRSRSSSRSHSRPQPVISKHLKKKVNAPPGKLGIILANKNDGKGTVVSGVRTTSALADKIFPGDRIIAIDGEDVSRMAVTEITSIMSRKGDYDRELTVLTSN